MLYKINNFLNEFLRSSLLELPYSLTLEPRWSAGAIYSYKLKLVRDEKEHSLDEMSGGQTTLMSMCLLLSVF